METCKVLPKETVFAYSIENRVNPLFHAHIGTKRLIVNHSCKTQVCQASTPERTVTIIGLCVDAHGELERFQVPDWIAAQKTDAPEALFNECDRFAGKFIMLIEEGNQAYLWGDATSSLQMDYAFYEENICISFSDKVTAEVFGFEPSETARDIRSNGSTLQPLPYDLTMYDSVKALLPNHYLDLNARRSVRVRMQTPSGADVSSINGIMERSLRLVLNTAREYGKYYRFACPVTSGYDSRVVYAILSTLGLDAERYTFRHKGFTDATADIAVPHQFITSEGKSHAIIDDLIAPKAFVERVCDFLGEWQSETNINLAYTILKSFPDLALASGDVIGQTGQCYVTNAVPNCLITPTFMQCKIHTESNCARAYLRDHRDEIKQSSALKSLCELFEWESRLGRWAPQAALVYGFCGINLLNVFNSREIILCFAALPRKARVNKTIHKCYLKKLTPELLRFPFNPDERHSWMKKNWLIFYLATYAKFFYGKLRRGRGGS